MSRIVRIEAAGRASAWTWMARRFRSKRDSRIAPISRTKGCYVGQEVIVEGAGSRAWPGGAAAGRPDAAADAAVPAAGAAITADGKDVGRVTGAAFSPAMARPVALGYVHRDFTGPARRSPSRARVTRWWPRYRSCPTRRAISSSSAGGNCSAGSSSRFTQRISCPSSGAGLPISVHSRKCNSTLRAG